MNSVIGTEVELKAWTLFTVVPESKGGSNPGYRSGLNSLVCRVSSSEAFPHYIIPHHLFQCHRKDKLHSPSVKALFDSGPYECT